MITHMALTIKKLMTIWSSQISKSTNISMKLKYAFIEFIIGCLLSVTVLYFFYPNLEEGNEIVKRACFRYLSLNVPYPRMRSSRGFRVTYSLNQSW